MRARLVLLLALSLTAACSSPAHGNTTAVPPAPGNLLGALGLGSPQDRAQYTKQSQVRVEDEVARCMRGAGFDYVPMTASVSTEDTAAQEPVDRDQAARDGFGVTTPLTLGQSTGATTRGSAADPNEAILAALDPTRREAYDQALEGGTAEPGSAGEGCRGRARVSVNGAVERAVTEMGDGVRDMGARIEADPRMVDAVRRWSDCLAAAGYHYAQFEDMYAAVHDRATPFLMAAGPAPAADPGPGGGPAPSSGARATAVQLARAQRDERALAVAHVRCMAPLRPALRQLYDDHVAQFAKSNQASVDVLRKALSTGQQ